MIRGRYEHGLGIEPRRPDALLGVRKNVQPHHGDREERNRCRRRKLHRESVAEQALRALVIGGKRHVGQPGRDRLRLITGRHFVEVALRQRGGVEEVRRREVGKADVFHPPALIAKAQCLPIGELDETRSVHELTIRLRVQHFVVGSDIRRVEWIRERAEGEAEVVVDGVGAPQLAGRKERPRVFAVERSRAVVVVAFGAGLDPRREAGRCGAKGQRPAKAVLVRAVVAVEAVEKLRGG